MQLTIFVHLCFQRAIYSRSLRLLCDVLFNLPAFLIFSDQTDEGFNLCGGDVFFEEFAVVVKESCDCVLGQDIVADLLLHEGKLFGDVLLEYKKIMEFKEYSETKMKIVD